MKNKNIMITGVVALIIGVSLGYFGGNALHPAAATPTRGNFSGMMGGAGRAGGNGLLSGTVAAKDSDSITIDTKDGSSHIVLLTPNTTFQKSVSGTESDVATGSTIIVSGTTNSDGSVSATSIQLRPAMPPATVQK